MSAIVLEQVATDFGLFRVRKRKPGWVTLYNDHWGEFAVRVDDDGWLSEESYQEMANQLRAIHRMEPMPMPAMPDCEAPA